MGETWEHVSVPWQQGKFLLWAKWKNMERHMAHTIVSWPNSEQWVIVHTSDLMMIIRQSIYPHNHHRGGRFRIWASESQRYFLLPTVMYNLLTTRPWPVRQKTDLHQVNGITHWTQQQVDFEQERSSTGLPTPGTGVWISFCMEKYLKRSSDETYILIIRNINHTWICIG